MKLDDHPESLTNWLNKLDRKCWCSKVGLEMFAAQSHKYSYTTKVKHKYSISLGRIYPIQIFTLEKILKLNLFCCNWICCANNWRIYGNLKMSVLRNVLFFLKTIHILEIYVYISEIEHFPTLRPNGALTPPIDIYPPNCWQSMSDTII